MKAFCFDFRDQFVKEFFKIITDYYRDINFLTLIPAYQKILAKYSAEVEQLKQLPKNPLEVFMALEGRNSHYLRMYHVLDIIDKDSKLSFYARVHGVVPTAFRTLADQALARYIYRTYVGYPLFDVNTWNLETNANYIYETKYRIPQISPEYRMFSQLISK